MCTALKIPSKHYLHFGRTAGNVLADLEELDETNIQDLGNWNLNTRREVYSAKLPMKAMRIMAGHSDQKASFFVARSLIEPPVTLQHKIFPFIEEACESLQAVPWSCTTAQCFLKLLERLRAVVLQDVAEMIIKEHRHIIFTDEVFQCDEFLSFVDRMREHLSHVQNPNNTSLQLLLPGIHDRFNNLHANFSAKCGELKNKFVENRTAHTAQLQHVLTVIGNIDVNNINEHSVEASHERNDNIITYDNQFHYDVYKHHCTYRSIYHEWYGTNEFDHNSNETCYKGGIRALENDFGVCWRSHYTAAQHKQYSRLKLTVQYLNKLGKIYETTAEDTLTAMDAHAKEFNACTITALEKLIKSYIAQVLQHT
jgi:hypothetical protein